MAFLDFTNPAPSRTHEQSPFNTSNRLTEPGPKQTRKMQPPADSPDTPGPNSSATVPNSGEVSGSDLITSLPSDAPTGEASVGMSALLSQLHQTTERETPLQRKHQRQDDGANEDDGEQKKTKTSHGISGGSGMISQHLKDEAKKHAANGGAAAAIDLTEDDDDLEITGGTPVPKVENGDEEVCIGVLPCHANTYRVPATSTFISKDHWPPTKLTLKRSSNNRDDIIELIDKQNRPFGRLGAMWAVPLEMLLKGSQLSGIRLKAWLPMRDRLGNEVAGLSTSRNVKVDVIIYCKRKSVDQMGKFLSQRQLFLTSPKANVDSGKRIENPHVPKSYRDQQIGYSAPKHSQTIAYTTRTAEEMKRDASTLFDNLAENENLPEKEGNLTIVKTELLPHQKQGLSFLTDHENHNDSTHDESDGNNDSSFWKTSVKVNGKKVWYNVITSQEVYEKPEPARGGILADDMGLGKTLLILALIAATGDEAKAFANKQLPQDARGVVRNVASTLVVCPTSVLSNWTEQVQNHIFPGKLSIYVYHGNNRSQDLHELSKYDIVLTTYDIVAREYSDPHHKRNALALLNWFRIVLDEAHRIRNASTAICKGACALEADRRWAVTGTPVQNRLEDLGALFRFLRIKPFDEPKNWAQYIIAPFKNASSDVIQNLAILVHNITLRRGKDKTNLPGRTEKHVFLEFTDKERQLYGAYASRANVQLKGMMGQNKTLRGKSYAHVFKSLIQMRRICDHGRELLSEEDLQELEGSDPDNAIDLGDEPELEVPGKFISDRQAYETFESWKSLGNNFCTSCTNQIVGKQEQQNVDTDSDSSAEGEDDDDEFGYLNPCGHLYCTKCKDQLVADAEIHTDGYYECPNCEAYEKFDFFPLSRRNHQYYLDDLSDTKKGSGTTWDPSTYSGPHTKVRALLAELEKSQQETAALPDGEPPIRSVVFTEWTSYLDLIQFALERHGHRFVRLDGKMRVKQRSDAINTFKTDNTVTVFLASIKAGGVGLNLTAASKVYVMEPQYNPGTELQAIDRVHRLGQTRDVEIVHFIMQKTCEEAIMRLQAKKKALANLSMDKKKTTKEKNLEKINEVLELFK
ncbi:hypothetical protein Q7P37_000102 [Cladosporium fusiforme]